MVEVDEIDEVDEVVEVDEVDKVDKVDEVDEVDDVDEVDEVGEVDKVDEVDEVNEVDEVDLTVDLTSESVKVSRGQLRSVSLSLAIHQTAGNTESYMSDGWDGRVDGIGLDWMGH